MDLIIAAAALVSGLLVGGLAISLRAGKARRSLEQDLQEQVYKVKNLGSQLHKQEQDFQQQSEKLQYIQGVYAEAREALAAQDERLSQLPRIERQEQDARQTIEELRQELSTQGQETAELRTALNKERQHHQEKLQQLEQAKKDMSQQFENLANRILEEKSKTFQEQNQNSLENLLNPLKENISSFRKKVEETYDKETQDRIRLRTEIEALAKSNKVISEEATNLAQALKGQNQAQGAWGEMILEKVLEKSGLEEGREYSVQLSVTGEDGRRSRPDVVVHLPNERDIVVDSKVSLVAYDRYQNAETNEEQAQALKEHTQSLQNHIRGLSSKNYQDLDVVRTLDYVLLFVPIEGAYSLAVQHQPELMQQALERNVVIVTPTTLLLALRTVENIWVYERQNRNALEIAEKAGALYDKFVGFTDDLARIQKSLGQAQDATDKAINKLSDGRGNLVRSTEQLKLMGAKAKKAIAATLLEEASAESAEDADTDRPEPETEQPALLEQ
ncbi:DNA recombination protein RmuC [Kiloniella sp. b19]|uniref:DNA recombination protein RmuC n=1 Tax=Kiloniella sp. GXU_MW_B19 TaxID=3141326 RepID=UPI0031D6C0A7